MEATNPSCSHHRCRSASCKLEFGATAEKKLYFDKQGYDIMISSWHHIIMASYYDGILIWWHQLWLSLYFERRYCCLCGSCIMLQNDRMCCIIFLSNVMLMIPVKSNILKYSEIYYSEKMKCIKVKKWNIASPDELL